MSTPKSNTRDELFINTIRTLSIDAIQKANSGHPGAPMGMAALGYTLWVKHLKHNPQNPQWWNRDRFVLSNGHASMLLYSLLHLCGYDVTLDDIKNFRQWGSKTPGHPEFGHTPGVETTTGPLGQGLMTAVGMAIAEAHLAAVYNQPDFNIIDHLTYVFCGDGDMMEGASHEAASLAGHLGLGKLIAFYDDNHISIEGDTALAFTEDVAKRFEAYNWQVINIGEEANNPAEISRAIEAAQAEKEKPTLIIARTHIGYGSPNLQDSEKSHGAPLGEEEVKLTKRNYGWPEDVRFYIPDEVKEMRKEVLERGAQSEAEWQKLWKAYQRQYPELAGRLEMAFNNRLPEGWKEELPVFDVDLASRQASGKVLNALAEKLFMLIGGSADLSHSNNSFINGLGYFQKDNYQNRNFDWGVREHVMAAACNGMALHGGVRPFCATFFVFTDYCRPAIRLSALMKQPVIYLMTHDSIGLGEDGPTHQPIEHLASLRAMPNLTIIRPADANETAFAWKAALENLNGPTMLVLTRQKLKTLNREKLAPASELLKGAYVLSKEKGGRPEVILIGSGSEVALCLEAQQELESRGISCRVVSMPSWELFEKQSPQYRESVLPSEVKARVAVEAGATQGWERWAGCDGEIIGIDTFGASAPAPVLFEKFGFTKENVVNTALKTIQRNKK
ncbi:MAG: transketolase [Calditrichia bacterium]